MTITTILVLVLAPIIAGVPNTIAQEQTTKATYAFVRAIPNPVGVNQQALLHFGITDPLPSVEMGWEEITVLVERPDGSTTTLGPYTTDATGATGDVFVPQQVGTYELKATFPGQEQTRFVGGQSLDIWFEPSESDVLELVVQEDPLPDYPATPLPEGYWTRPIDAQHRDWYRISGNTLPPFGFAANLGGYVSPYNEYAPETPHILWAKPFTTGGLAGGKRGVHGYEGGDAYEGKWSSSVIMNGVLYYNRYQSSMPQQGIVALDLRTGEELWFKNNTRLAFGQTFYFDSFNYHGVHDYLWETVGGGLFYVGPETWNAYDPFTGEWIYAMEDVPPGTTVRGPNGELLRYVVDTDEGWMALWNSTKVVMHGVTGPMAGSWRPQGRTYNATRGYSWNVSIPTGLPGSVNIAFHNDVIFGYGRQVSGFSGGALAIDNPPFHAWAISLDPASRGELMWNETYPAPPGDVLLSVGRVSPEDRVWTIWCKEHRTHYGYDLDTGEKLWGPTDSEDQLGIYETWSIAAYGRLYTHGMKGVIDCYNITTGEHLWSYESVDPLNEINWGNNWPIRIDFITDGKIYARHSVHSPIDPKPRGAPYTCLDAETGEVIWRANGLFRGSDWGGHAVIGDNIIATQDTYDQRIYAIGKGPSQVKVSIQDDVVPQGNSVLIKGTITDASAGTESEGVAKRFPDGVPCVADEDMSEWMKYVYKQFPCPDDVNGVPIKLEAIDPNGNTVDIGTVTSDGSGMFKKMWTPETEGEYTLIATFEGSKSYWPSWSQTALAVDPAPPETVSPTEQPAWYEEPPETVSPTEQPAWYEEPPETVSPTEQPEWYQKPPAYTTVDLVLIVAVIVIAILVVYDIFVARKRT